MSKGKSEKYLLVESLANSLREERNQMFKEIVRLRDEIKDLKENSYIYVVKDRDGVVVGYYRNYENAVKRIKSNEKEIEQLIRDGVIIYSNSKELNLYRFHMDIGEFSD